MSFHTFEVGLELVESIRLPVERIQKHDRDLAGQIRRAASSVPLNVAEGNRRGGQDRRQHFRIAAGSAAEVRAALLLAKAWGYVEVGTVERSLQVVDRQLALLWRLTEAR